jgi:outer membrane protein
MPPHLHFHLHPQCAKFPATGGDLGIAMDAEIPRSDRPFPDAVMDSTARPLRTTLRILQVAGLFLAGMLSSPAQTAPTAGTMPEDYFPGLRSILAEASRQSPTILAKNLELAQAEAGRHRAEAALYPSLGGSASYTASSSSVAAAGSDSSSSSSGLFYGINFSQNLFQFGAVKAGADIARISEKIAGKQYKEAYRTLAIAIRTQYLNLVIKKASVRMARFQLEFQEQEFKAKVESIERGESAPAERPTAETALERVRLSTDRQVQDFVNAKRILARIAGLTELTDESIPEVIPLPREPAGVSLRLLTGFLQGGVERTSQAQVLAYGVQQSALNVTISRTGTLPHFNLGGGYSLSNSTSVDGVGNLSQAAVGSKNYSVGMGWTLWDSGATKWSKRSALASKTAAERGLKNYIETSRDDAVQKEKLVGFAYREMALVERDRESSLNALNIEKDRLELGTTSRLAVDRATVSLNTADLSAFYSRAAYLVQWTEFVSLVDADPVTNNLPVSY